jgi:hypothetical protein
MPTFELPKFEMPTFELPKFELPNFELPKIDLPEIDLPELPSSEQVLAFARDAAYVGVGLAVVTAERLAEWQRELVELLKAQIERVRNAV